MPRLPPVSLWELLRSVCQFGSHEACHGLGSGLTSGPQGTPRLLEGCLQTSSLRARREARLGEASWLEQRHQWIPGLSS